MDEPIKPSHAENAAQRMGCMLGLFDTMIGPVALPLGLGLVVMAVCLAIRTGGEAALLGLVGGILLGIGIKRQMPRRS
jgi:hypothetical protein